MSGEQASEHQKQSNSQSNMIKMTALFIYKVDAYSVGLYCKQAAPCTNVRSTSDEGHTSASLLEPSE